MTLMAVMDYLAWKNKDSTVLQYLLNIIYFGDNSYNNQYSNTNDGNHDNNNNVLFTISTKDK